MLKLGVNIDHVATIREARYRGRLDGEPCPVEAARLCETVGAHGITAHLREDRRHIQDRDVWQLRQSLQSRLNLEMANVPEIIEIALRVQPHVVCLVPERRAELTTEGGLDAVNSEAALSETRRRMNDAGIEVSLFIDPVPQQVEAAARIGAQFIELHTGTFAEQFRSRQARPSEVDRLKVASLLAHGLGLKVNAGHGLDCRNLPVLLEVPHLVELNIGHSLVSRSVMIGLGAAVQEMLQIMQSYP